jgi:monoamine oxidase
MDRDWDTEDTRPYRSCAEMAGKKVAVVGGGLAGLMAARTLAMSGATATVYEARAQVGGRVLSDSTFAQGRITELGAELIGSIHTRWCALAREYGISLISRMDGKLYRGQQLEQRMILDRLLTAKEIKELEDEAEAVLTLMAEYARKHINKGMESQPWNQPRKPPPGSTAAVTAASVWRRRSPLTWTPTRAAV